MLKFELRHPKKDGPSIHHLKREASKELLLRDTPALPSAVPVFFNPAMGGLAAVGNTGKGGNFDDDNNSSGHSPPLKETSSTGSTTTTTTKDFTSSKQSSKKYFYHRDLEFGHPQNNNNNGEEHQKKEARFNLCCAWASLIVGTFILILLLLGVLFFSFYGSNMPDFSVKSLTVNKLQFNTTGRDILMDSEMEVALNATSKDSNIEFYYTNMRAEISSSGVSLGNIKHVPGFHQKAKNSTLLKLHTKVNKQPVAEADSLRLANDLQYHRLVIDVDLKGFIIIILKGNKLLGFLLEFLAMI